MIEVAQSVAGEFCAVAAELAVSIGTDANAAVDAGFGLVLLRIVAAMARIVFAQESFANRAIHPTRRNQIFVNPVRHFRPYLQ